MERNNLVNNLVDFSKSLLVLVFAIFSFISGTFLNSDNCYIKIIYVVALILAIVSIFFGFNGTLVNINYFWNRKIKEANIYL